MIGIHDLPAVNATLNGTAAVLLITGYLLIRSGRNASAQARDAGGVHGLDSCFCISYLIYHAQVGSVHYPHPANSAHGLSHDSDHAHDSGRDRTGAGDHHAAPRV